MLQQARAGVQIDYGHPIRIPDVQNLIMWTLADGTNPQWVFLMVSATIPHHSAYLIHSSGGFALMRRHLVIGFCAHICSCLPCRISH